MKKRKGLYFAIALTCIIVVFISIVLVKDVKVGDYEVTLPESYETGDRNYPVVYVLPQDGYTIDDSGITEQLQKVMSEGLGTDMIIVRPAFKQEQDIYGSMEALIKKIDTSYRTIADKNYRAVIGTGTGGYLAYILGLTDEENITLKESKLFSAIASIRGDFVSEENSWYDTYGDVSEYIKEMWDRDDSVFDGFYTYMDAPVEDAWTNMEGSSNDMGAQFIHFGTGSAAHEFTVRPGAFTEEFLAESAKRVADRLTNNMLSDVANGTVTLKDATLSAEEETAEVTYTIDLTEAIGSFVSEESSVDVVVSVIDPNTDEILAETICTQKIDGAGTYTGEVSVENFVNGTSSDVRLSMNLFGANIELATASLTRSQDVIIEGDYQKIDLSGDWYFNYIGRTKRIDIASLDAKEYKTWPVVQPGLENWKKGFGNISDDNVNTGYSGEDYFDYFILGNAYYVKEFEVPMEFDSQDLILSIGYVDDRCEVYLNGERVGATGMDEHGNPTGNTTWAEFSKFTIAPESLVRGGTNTVVVRAYNDGPYGAGGWYKGPITLCSQTVFDNPGGTSSHTDEDASRFVEKTFQSSYAATALSQSGMADVSYLLYLPEDYEKSEQYYPTVYLLHQFNSDHTSYKIDGIDQLLDEAIASGLFDEMIVVVPNSEEESWWTGDWEKMLTEELIPLIDSEYRTIKDARYRLTAGCSMGGQGAFGIALTNPDYFSGAVSFFGALSMPPTEAENALKIAEKETEAYLNYYSLYFICGNQDSYGFGVPAIELNQILTKKGIEHGFFIENGGHDSVFYVPYFKEAFSYVRSQMYQSDKLVEELLSGKLAVKKYKTGRI